jgi:hypothetical protein
MQLCHADGVETSLATRVGFAPGITTTMLQEFVTAPPDRKAALARRWRRESDVLARHFPDVLETGVHLEASLFAIVHCGCGRVCSPHALGEGSVALGLHCSQQGQRALACFHTFCAPFERKWFNVHGNGDGSDSTVVGVWCSSIGCSFEIRKWGTGDKIVVVMEAIELRAADVRLSINATQRDTANITVMQCAHARLLQGLGITPDQLIGIDKDELEPATYSISVPLPGIVDEINDNGCYDIVPIREGPYFVWELTKVS